MGAVGGGWVEPGWGVEGGKGEEFKKGNGWRLWGEFGPIFFLSIDWKEVAKKKKEKPKKNKKTR